MALPKRPAQTQTVSLGLGTHGRAQAVSLTQMVSLHSGTRAHGGHKRSARAHRERVRPCSVETNCQPLLSPCSSRTASPCSLNGQRIKGQPVDVCTLQLLTALLMHTAPADLCFACILYQLTPCALTGALYIVPATYILCILHQITRHRDGDGGE